MDLSDECKLALGLESVVDEDFDTFSEDSSDFDNFDDSEVDSIAVKGSRLLLGTEITVLASTARKIQSMPEQKCDFELPTPKCWCEFNGKKSLEVEVYHKFLLDLRPLNCDVELFE